MNNKRDLYIHSRVTRQEMQVVDAVARYMRRTRSDTLRVLALEKAEELGLQPDPPKPIGKIGQSIIYDARDAI